MTEYKEKERRVMERKRPDVGDTFRKRERTRG